MEATKQNSARDRRRALLQHRIRQLLDPPIGKGHSLPRRRGLNAAAQFIRRADSTSERKTGVKRAEVVQRGWFKMTADGCGWMRTNPSSPMRLVFLIR